MDAPSSKSGPLSISDCLKIVLDAWLLRGWSGRSAWSMIYRPVGLQAYKQPHAAVRQATKRPMLSSPATNPASMLTWGLAELFLDCDVTDQIAVSSKMQKNNQAEFNK